MGDGDDLLNEQLDRRARVRAEAARAQQAGPYVTVDSDPEIADLFKAFVARMPASTAIPFVEMRLDEGVEVHRHGFLGRKSFESPFRRWDEVEIERGWVLLNGQKLSLGSNKCDQTTYLVHALGVTTTAEARLVGWRYLEERPHVMPRPRSAIVRGPVGPGILVGDPPPFGPIPGTEFRSAVLRSARISGGDFPGVKFRPTQKGSRELDPATGRPLYVVDGGAVADAASAEASLPAGLAQAMAELLDTAADT